MQVNCFPSGLSKSLFSNMIETGAILMDVKDCRSLNEQGVYLRKTKNKKTPPRNPYYVVRNNYGKFWSFKHTAALPSNKTLTIT